MPGGIAGDCLWLALAIAVFAIQELGISHVGRDGPSAFLRAAIFLVTTGILIGMALHFRRFLGAWLIALGITMNFIPMALHGGLMPAAYEIIEDSGAFPEITVEDVGHQLPNSKDIVLWREDVRAFPLSDNLYIEAPGVTPNIYSPGDLVILLGVALAAVEAVAQVFGFQRRRPANVTAPAPIPDHL